MRREEARPVRGGIDRMRAGARRRRNAAAADAAGVRESPLQRQRQPRSCRKRSHSDAASLLNIQMHHTHANPHKMRSTPKEAAAGGSDESGGESEDGEGDEGEGADQARHCHTHNSLRRVLQRTWWCSFSPSAPCTAATPADGAHGGAQGPKSRKTRKAAAKADKKALKSETRQARALLDCCCSAYGLQSTIV